MLKPGLNCYICIMQVMDKYVSIMYEAPAVTILEVKTECNVCQSGLGARSGYDPDDDNPFADQ